MSGLPFDPRPTTVTHVEGRVCTLTEGPDARYVYWDADGTRHDCEWDHSTIQITTSTMPEPEPSRSYDEMDLGSVLDGDRSNVYPNEPQTPRGILLFRLAANIDEQAEARRQADDARQRAEAQEDRAEALEPVIRELEDAVRVLTADTPTTPDHG